MRRYLRVRFDAIIAPVYATNLLPSALTMSRPSPIEPSYMMVIHCRSCGDAPPPRPRPNLNTLPSHISLLRPKYSLSCLHTSAAPSLSCNPHSFPNQIEYKSSLSLVNRLDLIRSTPQPGQPPFRNIHPPSPSSFSPFVSLSPLHLITCRPTPPRYLCSISRVSRDPDDYCLRALRRITAPYQGHCL